MADVFTLEERIKAAVHDETRPLPAILRIVREVRRNAPTGGKS